MISGLCFRREEDSALVFLDIVYRFGSRGVVVIVYFLEGDLAGRIDFVVWVLGMAVFFRKSRFAIG